MATVNFLQGTFASRTGELAASLPINRDPVILDVGLSRVTLRLSPGIVSFGPGLPGFADRGGLVWDGVHYRVMGSKLVSVDAAGAITVLGDVGNDDRPAVLDNSFDRLGVCSDGALWFWDKTTLTRVTDEDLGRSEDAVFLAGYWLSTDGTFIVASTLGSPLVWGPLRYASAEFDPDPVTGLARLRGELLVFGRFTIQVFKNVGGNGFPFANIPSASIERGAVGRDAIDYFVQTVAFVGGGKNEALGVHLASGGGTVKISSRQIEDCLALLSDVEAAAIQLESVVELDDDKLLLHLPDFTYVYFRRASEAAGEPIWCRRASGSLMNLPYTTRNYVLANGRFVGGDNLGRLGYWDYTAARHYGQAAGWQFDTLAQINPEGRVIVHDCTLRGALGFTDVGQQEVDVVWDDARVWDDSDIWQDGSFSVAPSNPQVFRSYSFDGVTFSTERAASAGRRGAGTTMLQWRNGFRADDWFILRFRGADDGFASFSMLDLRVEALGG